MVVTQQGIKINVKSEISVDIKLSPNDIYNLIIAHSTEADLPMLKTLGKQLQSHIRSIEHPDDDDYQ